MPEQVAFKTWFRGNDDLTAGKTRRKHPPTGKREAQQAERARIVEEVLRLSLTTGLTSPGIAHRVKRSERVVDEMRATLRAEGRMR
jgi:hypothetical protein